MAIGRGEELQMGWLQDAAAFFQHDRVGIAFKGTEISMCLTPKAKGYVSWGVHHNKSHQTIGAQVIETSPFLKIQ